MSDPVIDLRSDTVTRPTPAMRKAMSEAEVGDDVLGDEPTVQRLQARVAEVLGKPAAVYVPSGTMANQCAIRAHTEPGDEVLAHRDSHIIHYETGGPAAMSGVMIAPLDGAFGRFDVDDVVNAVHPDNVHSPRSRLLLIENTHNRGGGSVWPLEQVKRVSDAARERGLKTHLDGARLWNACAATGHDPKDYARCFDTVSVCFSKGLGAPVGSAVAGEPAMMQRVLRFRKMFGGAMRQSGIIAAGALHALEHHRARLVEDHANARRLADGLHDVAGITIPHTVESNMVFFDLDSALGTAAELCAALKTQGVWTLPNSVRRVRAVCHLDVSTAMIDRAVSVIASQAKNKAR